MISIGDRIQADNVAPLRVVELRKDGVFCRTDDERRIPYLAPYTARIVVLRPRGEQLEIV
jgi:hypothetical protein